MRDDRKPVLLGSGASGGKPKVSIYSAAGGLIQTITVSAPVRCSPPSAVSEPAPHPGTTDRALLSQWDVPSKIIQLGWTLTESLVVLTQDGTYRLYPLSTLSPASYTQHTLGPDAQEAGVLEARIYEEGMVVLLGSLQFVEVKGWERKERSQGGRVVSLVGAGLTERPACWCVLRPEVSSSRGVEVIIGTERTVLRLDEIEVQDLVSVSAISLPDDATANASGLIHSTSRAGHSSPSAPPPTGASSACFPPHQAESRSYGSPRPTSRGRCPSSTSVARARRARLVRPSGAATTRLLSLGRGRS